MQFSPKIQLHLTREFLLCQWPNPLRNAFFTKPNRICPATSQLRLASLFAKIAIRNIAGDYLSHHPPSSSVRFWHNVSET
jgi:hypothetical protein